MTDKINPTIPSSPPPDHQEEPKVIHADFIYVDDKQVIDFEEEQKREPHPESFATNWAKDKGSRFLYFIAFVFCLLFMLGLLIGAGVLGAAALLFLFRNQRINRYFFTYLKILLGVVIAAIGCIVGMLNPALVKRVM